MKEALYSILDGEYCILLDRITKIFKEKELNPAIVGGAAVQAHVADLLSSAYGKTIEELFLEGDMRRQDHIRETDDIDMAVLNNNLIKDPQKYQETIKSAIEKLPGKNIVSPDENDIYDISMQRMGLKRPVINVRSFNKDSRISMNISNSPNDLYHLGTIQYVAMLEGAKELTLNYNSLFKPTIRVYQLEDVIAAKLSACRPKDVFDILNLRECAKKAGRSISKQRLTEILGDTHEGLEKIEDFFEGKLKIG